MPLSRRAISILFPLFILAVTLAAYIPVMASPVFIWDDDSYVTNNPVYYAPDALHQIWFVPSASPQYYPIVFTTFYIERLFYGLNPLGYHILNILLHAGSAILLWLVLKRLRIPGAMLAAAVFALHPMMVESVAWVTERKNTLSTFFFLLSLLAFLFFALPKEPGAAETAAASELKPRTAPAWFCYALSLLFFIVALLSKSVACGLAPVLVLILWCKREKLTKAAGINGLIDYLLTIPYFVLGAASGLFTAHLEKTQVGAQGDAWTLHFTDKILLASQAIWFYIYKLLFPAQLSFYYWRWPINPALWWQWLFPAALIAAFVLLFLFRKRIGDWPLAAAIMFVALLFPALGFFPLYPMLFSWVADHFAYLASLAFIPAICALMALAAHRRFPSQTARGILAAMLLLALGAKTFATAQNYRSLEALWTSVLQYDPQHPHWVALSGMSMILRSRASLALQNGDREQASAGNEQARLLDEASLRVKPDYLIAYDNLAIYHRMKIQLATDPSLIPEEAHQAVLLLEKAIALDPRPAYLYATLGGAYGDAKQWEKAVAAYAQAIVRDPANAGDQFLMARALVESGQAERALPYLDRALALDPNHVGALVLTGAVYVHRDDYPRALEYFRRAVQIDPTDLEAADYFINAAIRAKDASNADLNAALDLARNNVARTQTANLSYLDTLALVLRRAGRYADSVTLLQRALARPTPADPELRATMARQLAAWIPQGTMPAPVAEPLPR